ncbi:MAG: hypothetical protein COW73_02505 [Nitrospirae bacterium CG18_big_fil_WC_8_21_14_2_50_70_55]|nr:hypothetical protein [Deltaproteobacteria bacterium]OIP64850.1 MAG: hypothetical protein AUK30_05845 [Nitrospirae bacterium CG2_30_70_394]PIQ06733.1 MAG: hypothetical protein COW73_02505 [Nitrospirae bacterium CG18_big_fil_WC_8_21_14_2_50_70_55]PIU79199.1 MAG: hypothetical protein COS73_04695 [Nitrospirae bacterium CG06_land_8_20_14_3_00_70_43]PIW83540.1 MAG: hypothetical protein COZ96_02845 [Nitrospirae bacterium CG_4_8_14_3_um_filter_70_85]
MALLALDLGSTRIKAAIADAAGQLGEVGVVAAPPLRVAGAAVSGDAAAYAAAARALVDRLGGASPSHRLAVACQRSSFLLWDRATGAPATRLICWQDRSAAAWCGAHRHLAAAITAATGLPLSPHYAGPKLAALLAQEPHLRPRLATGSLRFGTLESFLLGSLSRGSLHRTDLTMASRTLLVDLATGSWSAPLLDAFGIPPACLPELGLTAGIELDLAPHLRLVASIADQPAACLALLGGAATATVVNLGTGGFVLHPTGTTPVRLPGYLTTPLCALAAQTLFALEGTINGAGAALDRYGSPPTDLPETDPTPDAFCLPDLAGAGAPHWRPDLGFTLSSAAQPLGAAGRRRVVLEGLLFRVREILDALAPAGDRVVVGGGATLDPAVAAGLAALLGRPVAVAGEAEATLTGAARLAALAPPPPATRTVAASPAGAYLPEKYPRWRAWLGQLLR